MYRIKPNGNYILLIKDLGLTLTFDGNGALLTDSEFENSVDVKKFLRYLTVKKIDGKANLAKAPIDNVTIEKKSEMFVARQKNDEEPKNVFIKNAEEVSQEIAEPIKVEIQEDIVPEEIVETIEIIEEKVVEKIATEEIVSEQKVEKEITKDVVESDETKKKSNKKNKSVKLKEE